MVAFVALVVLHARRLCFACTSQRFAIVLILPAVCTNHYVDPTSAYTTLYTKPRFTPTTVHTNHRLQITPNHGLHQPPLHQSTVYTNHSLHQPPLAPSQGLHQPQFTPHHRLRQPPFTPNHGLHQPPFTPKHGLHPPPFSRSLLVKPKASQNKSKWATRCIPWPFLCDASPTLEASSLALALLATCCSFAFPFSTGWSQFMACSRASPCPCFALCLPLPSISLPFSFFGSQRVAPLHTCCSIQPWRPAAHASGG